MIDVVLGMIEILKADSDIIDLISDRVYGEFLPRKEIENMPRGNVVFVSNGGDEENKTDTIFKKRLDVWSYGNTIYAASVLDRIVCEIIKNIQRKTIRNMLIHSAALAGGPTRYIDPDTGYPAMIRSITIVADQREVA